MPRMTSWNWLNIKDSRQFSLQHGCIRFNEINKQVLFKTSK